MNRHTLKFKVRYSTSLHVRYHSKFHAQSTALPSLKKQRELIQGPINILKWWNCFSTKQHVSQNTWSNLQNTQYSNQIRSTLMTDLRGTNSKFMIHSKFLLKLSHSICALVCVEFYENCTNTRTLDRETYLRDSSIADDRAF